MLKDRKLRPGQRCPVGVVFVSCLMSQEGSNPTVRVITFFTFFLSTSFYKFSVNEGRVSFSIKSSFYGYDEL